jgi:HAD superfamily hydrolase (TIGR01490 family)
VLLQGEILLNLALFDFDGTLTTKDSLGVFLKYSVGTQKYILNMFRFIPYFFLWKIGMMRNDVAKRHLFKIFFKGIDESEFKDLAKGFAKEKLSSIIHNERVALLKTHQANGDRVIVVSASMKCWLEPWCREMGVELLSTELEFKKNRFSGAFLTPNCHGKEKVARVKEYLNIDNYDTIYAYGDSSGDDEMLAMANVAKRF